jgi:hypothetical protein
MRDEILWKNGVFHPDVLVSLLLSEKVDDFSKLTHLRMFLG